MSEPKETPEWQEGDGYFPFEERYAAGGQRAPRCDVSLTTVGPKLPCTLPAGHVGAHVHALEVR